MKKMIKKLTVTVVLTGLMVCLTACGKSDKVKDDLYTYLTEMTEVQELQKSAINEYNTCVANEEADSQQLLSSLQNSIIPNYENYLEKLNAVAPETEEVQNIKTVCVNGANKQLEALNKVAEAIEACDTDLLNEADTLIVESETLFSDYENQLNALAAEHEINLVNSGAGAGQENNSAEVTEAE